MIKFILFIYTYFFFHTTNFPCEVATSTSKISHTIQEKSCLYSSITYIFCFVHNGVLNSMKIVDFFFPTNINPSRLYHNACTWFMVTSFKIRTSRKIHTLGSARRKIFLKRDRSILVSKITEKIPLIQHNSIATRIAKPFYIVV